MPRPLLSALTLTLFLMWSCPPAGAAGKSPIPETKGTKPSVFLKDQDAGRDSVKLYLPSGHDELFLKEALKKNGLYDTREGQVWNEMTFGYFRLSLSSMLMEESAARNYLRSTWEFKPPGSSLSDDLILKGSYRDTLRSVGGAIEPEIKIKIEF